MNNQEVARTFELLADMLDIEGKENKFAILAYRRAAEQIANLDRDINPIAQAGELRSIAGIGQAIADKITSLLNTGSFDLLDRMKATIPAGLVEMLAKRLKAFREVSGIPRSHLRQLGLNLEDDLGDGVVVRGRLGGDHAADVP